MGAPYPIRDHYKGSHYVLRTGNPEREKAYMKHKYRTHLLTESYQCGEIAAFAFLGNEDAGFSWHRIDRADKAKSRADEIADVLGPEADNAFNDGFAAILP